MPDNLLVDSFGRRIDYVRLSVTDRCDFRCVYCMAEDMTFLPRRQILSLEELWQTAQAFHELGVEKIRITGGEPLIRKGVVGLFQRLGQLGLRDLSVTTNGSQLPQLATALADAGVHRVNISLDSLQPHRFRALTRTGDLHQVLAGIAAAEKAGFRHIRLNCVIMRSRNADEIQDLAHFALDQGLNLSFIEEMPLGVIEDHDRAAEFVSSEEIRTRLQERWTLTPADYRSGGPARYWSVKGYDSLIGFISPHSHNFCSSCNRVRVSVEGRLLLCLGNEHSADLKRIVRVGPPHEAVARLKRAIRSAIVHKPEKHHFDLAAPPQILRFMSATGG